jgi:hypothetical protein
MHSSDLVNTSRYLGTVFLPTYAKVLNYCFGMHGDGQVPRYSGSIRQMRQSQPAF